MAKIPTINCFKFIKEVERTPSFQTLIDEYITPQLIELGFKTRKPDPSFMEAIGQAMAETIDKMHQPQIETTTFQTPFEIELQPPDSDIWESTNKYFNDEVEAIKDALIYSKWHPEHIVRVFSGTFIVKIRNGEPFKIYEGHEEQVLAALGTDVQNQILDDWFGPIYGQQHAPENQPMDVVMNVKIESCPDCKDGFYYPFVGPKEPCQTCK